MLSVGEVTATIVVLFHTTEARREYRITPSSSFYFGAFASWALFSYTQTLFVFGCLRAINRLSKSITYTFALRTGLTPMCICSASTL